MVSVLPVQALAHLARHHLYKSLNMLIHVIHSISLVISIQIMDNPSAIDCNLVRYQALMTSL